MIQSGELKELMIGCPVKHIEINDKPYIDRYYATTLPDGTDVWLHHFRSADGERNLHCHPFNARSIVLRGGYTQEIERPEDCCVVIEERKPPEVISMTTLTRILDGKGSHIINMMDAIGYVANIQCTTWHRVTEVEPDTWSLMLVEPGRIPMWFFKDDDGCVIPQKAAPREWWL